MGTSEQPLTMAELAGKGRALISSRPLKAGEIILRDSPLLLYSALPFSSNSSYCSHCYRALKSPHFHPCSSCSGHLFCNPTCLSKALSSSHTSFVCQALTYLQACPALVNNTEHQAQASFLVAAYNLALFSNSLFTILLSLQGESSNFPSLIESAMFMHSLLSSFSPLMSVSGFSVELTASLLAKDKLNAFGLMEPVREGGERSVRAYGLYAKASLFNHDCLPNACRFDYLDGEGEGNVDIVIRMIHDVPQGREICLSYFPVNERYANRQKRLMEDYGFKCECDRCRVEANWSEDEDEVENEDEAMEEEGDGEEDDDQDDEGMGLDDGEGEGSGQNNDFPHAYFFLRYMCARENCGGTLAPVPPGLDGSSSDVMECNVCGSLKKDDVIVGSLH